MSERQMSKGILQASVCDNNPSSLCKVPMLQGGWTKLSTLSDEFGLVLCGALKMGRGEGEKCGKQLLIGKCFGYARTCFGPYTEDDT